MVKNLFVKEYKINVSEKRIFPLISTASGLNEWIADSVTIDKNNHFIFKWTHDELKAEITSLRKNQMVEFQFLEEEQDPNRWKFTIEIGEITQDNFLKIEDYSEINQEEVNRFWDGLIQKLKHILGG